MHSKTKLSSAEKTVYLQQALKDGTAKGAIEGLSHSGDNYEKATWSVTRHAMTNRDSSRELMCMPLSMPLRSKMEVVRSLENYMITFNSISVHS